MIQIDTIKFLNELYVNAEGWLTLWSKQDQRTAWFDVTNHQLIADTAESVGQDIYFGVGISNQRKAKGLLKGFQDFIRSRATINKWKLNTIHDLSRVLRLPGTMNYKSDLVPVTVISHNNNRYNPSDFEFYAASIVAPDKRDKFERNPTDGPYQMGLLITVILSN